VIGFWLPRRGPLIELPRYLGTSPGGRAARMIVRPIPRTRAGSGPRLCSRGAESPSCAVANARRNLRPAAVGTVGPGGCTAGAGSATKDRQAGEERRELEGQGEAGHRMASAASGAVTGGEGSGGATSRVGVGASRGPFRRAGKPGPFGSNHSKVGRCSNSCVTGRSGAEWRACGDTPSNVRAGRPSGGPRQVELQARQNAGVAQLHAAQPRRDRRSGLQRQGRSDVGFETASAWATASLEHRSPGRQLPPGARPSPHGPALTRSVRAAPFSESRPTGGGRHQFRHPDPRASRWPTPEHQRKRPDGRVRSGKPRVLSICHSAPGPERHTLGRDDKG